MNLSRFGCEISPKNSCLTTVSLLVVLFWGGHGNTGAIWLSESELLASESDTCSCFQPGVSAPWSTKIWAGCAASSCYHRPSSSHHHVFSHHDRLLSLTWEPKPTSLPWNDFCHISGHSSEKRSEYRWLLESFPVFRMCTTSRASNKLYWVGREDVVSKCYLPPRTSVSPLAKWQEK